MAVKEVVWLVLIFIELRHAPATTRRLADICGIQAGHEFGKFGYVLRKYLVPLGKVVDPTTKHENIVWGRPPT